MLKPYAAKAKAALVIVDSTLRALQELARFHMERIGAIRVGVTGSNGKTTTKELVGAILSAEGSTAVAEGNLNSDIGLPLAVFEVSKKDEYAVFELGMNRAGEMDELVSIVRPQVALITNIGVAHIGILGSQESIAAEKARIFSTLEKDRSGWVHEDEPYLDFLRRGRGSQVATYGERSTDGFEGWEDHGLDGSAIKWRGRTLRLALPGLHNLRNALGAISLCSSLGASEKSVQQGIESVKAMFGRSQILRGPITIIQDCYNANPDSMETVIRFLQGLSWSGPRIAILGSMRELGAETERAHRDMGRQVSDLGLDAVVFVGEETKTARDALLSAGYAGACRWFASAGEAASEMNGIVPDGSLVLVKGSRSLELETLVRRLTEAAG
ncbi:MAG: UDP-N-acetylmuramoyl-tripeptide--D-alanyl-D-alanine ligase [Candidatus Competibacteraceae bacterium]|nr:UDP-N-acetylmuramoyl-tripeptide--D-alanyl-D-alanine ligase [Candidatus Competibacteraceae bacterium]